MKRKYIPFFAVALCGCAQPKSGLLIMAHGGDAQWNEEVMATVAPLRADYPTEVAFGMATPSTIEAAIERLQAQGVRKIAVVRMFISGDSFLEPTEYIVGLRDTLPPDAHASQAKSGQDGVVKTEESNRHQHVAMTTSTDNVAKTDHLPTHDGNEHHCMEPPRRIRATAQFVLSREGVAESPLIDQILVDRVRALSRDPMSESVLILGHGPADDVENERWLKTMQKRAGPISEIGRFRAVRCETLREDWPEKRAAAENRIRKFVEEGSQASGRVIIVPFRVSGFGPYKEVLTGMNYIADGRGFCPHANMTGWLRETAQKTLASD